MGDSVSATTALTRHVVVTGWNVHFVPISSTAANFTVSAPVPGSAYTESVGAHSESGPRIHFVDVWLWHRRTVMTVLEKEGET